MEEVKQVLALFNSQEKWNAFIELSNMKDDIVNELKSRLLVELQIIADNSLADSGWLFGSDNNGVYIKPKRTELIAISIEWSWWNQSNVLWCKRGTFLWVDANSIDSSKVFEQVQTYRNKLAFQDYVENIQNHTWFPYVKQIPASVFNVNESTTSIEECLYMAKDNAKLLAENLWKQVFEPFANKECANLMEFFVINASK